ncbi:transcriptional regulator [Candidatus Bathyarchaeota archaeon]|nr:transcriptional regulator [Candidatus Bathyarchaeota archaeon]MBL7079065.1 transcriptional regulator [Candidatus Bathyarchaeota archaeon]
MRRNDLDICADILKVSKAGAKKTHIVYRANLNFKIVKKYLSRLIDNGFLMDRSDNGIFVTTERGSDFLEQYARLTIPLGPTGID